MIPHFPLPTQRTQESWCIFGTAVLLDAASKGGAAPTITVLHFFSHGSRRGTGPLCFFCFAFPNESLGSFRCFAAWCTHFVLLPLAPVSSCVWVWLECGLSPLPSAYPSCLGTPHDRKKPRMHVCIAMYVDLFIGEAERRRRHQLDDCSFQKHPQHRSWELSLGIHVGGRDPGSSQGTAVRSQSWVSDRYPDF